MHRFARQIAELKSKLAEKDAALLGGFGAMSNMVLNEVPSQSVSGKASSLPPLNVDAAPLPPTTTASSNQGASGGGGGFRMPTPPASLASLKR